MQKIRYKKNNNVMAGNESDHRAEVYRWMLTNDNLRVDCYLIGIINTIVIINYMLFFLFS